MCVGRRLSTINLKCLEAAEAVVSCYYWSSDSSRYWLARSIIYKYLNWTPSKISIGLGDSNYFDISDSLIPVQI